MNPVLHAGAETAQMGWLLGWTTVIFIGAMLGWTWWVFSPSRAEMFEEVGRMPIDGGDR
ncbi:MAG: hypothetical protein R3F59_14065 [Myxococcota bacterium]